MASRRAANQNWPRRRSLNVCYWHKAPPPVGVHIGTQAFAVAGINERHILTWIKAPTADLLLGL
jgi:hypothetical protein